MDKCGFPKGKHSYFNLLTGSQIPGNLLFSDLSVLEKVHLSTEKKVKYKILSFILHPIRIMIQTVRKSTETCVKDTLDKRCGWTAFSKLDRDNYIKSLLLLLLLLLLSFTDFYYPCLGNSAHSPRGTLVNARNWINSVQGRDYWKVLVYTPLNFRAT